MGAILTDDGKQNIWNTRIVQNRFSRNCYYKVPCIVLFQQPYNLKALLSTVFLNVKNYIISQIGFYPTCCFCWCISWDLFAQLDRHYFLLDFKWDRIMNAVPKSDVRRHSRNVLQRKVENPKLSQSNHYETGIKCLHFELIVDFGKACVRYDKKLNNVNITDISTAVIHWNDGNGIALIFLNTCTRILSIPVQ